MTSTTKRALVVGVALAALTAGCGGGDDEASTSTTSAVTVAPTSTTTSGGGDALCMAYLDFENAQDGAERNTAIGKLRSLLDDPAMTTALDTVEAGDQSPADVTAASDAIGMYLDPLCGG